MANKSPRISTKNVTSKRKRNRSRLEYQRCEDRNLLAADFVAAPAEFAPVRFDGVSAVQSAEETVIRQHLSSDPATAWLQSGLNDLEFIETSETADSSTTVLQQTWNGLPVHGSYVTITQDADGNVTGVRDKARQDISGYATNNAPINVLQATEIGTRGLGGEAQSDSSLAWYYAGNKARLAWLVESTVTDPIDDSTHKFDTWVNIFNGNIFARETHGEYVSELLSNGIAEPELVPYVTINDDIGEQGSRDYAAPFDAVVQISVGCTGTLISPDTVLSARHCNITAGDIINFGDNRDTPDFQFTVASSSNPAGGNAGSPLLDGGDVSIHRLTEQVPESVATPMRLIDATDDLVGQTGLWIGYGLNGLGSTGSEGTADGFRWAAENIIDNYGSPLLFDGENVFTSDFDNGDAGNNTTGSETPLVFEGMGGPGDSGGPMLVNVNDEWVVAAVVSGGTTRTSEYGTVGWWTGTSIYRAEIEAAGGEFADAGAGVVSFSQDTYFIGDTITVNVVDPNVEGSIDVLVTSDSGDQENVTVSPDSNGNYVFTLESAFANTRFNDGTLQVAADDEIQVTYTDADDGSGNTEERTDTAMILEVIASDSPVAVSDTGITNEDQPVNLNIKANDFDPNGDEITLDAVNSPANGTAVLNPNGTVDYTPNADFFGTDIFTYEISDPAGNMATGTVSVNVISVNDAPTDVSLSLNFIDEGIDTSSDVFVGTLSGVDVDHMVHTFGLVEGSGDSDNDLFVIDGDSLNLRAGTIVDFDAKPEYSVRVSATDGEFTIERSFTINVIEEELPVAISLNNGENQRSMLSDAVLTFDQAVNIQDGAFELVKRGPDGGAVTVTPAIDNSTGRTIVTLTFSGEFVDPSGSLSDGNYQLTVFGNLVTDLNGNDLDGDGDGEAGGDYVFGNEALDNFFRFFGDGNGDRLVSGLDLLRFRQTYLDTIADSSFDARFDYNDDGRISGFDLLQFRRNYLDRLDFA